MQLQTTSLIEPVLQASSQVRLLVIHIRVVVEIIHRPNHIQCLANRHTGSTVSTKTIHVAILATQHLSTHRGSTVLPIVHTLHVALPFSTRRPTVTGVVLAHLNRWVIDRSRNSVARTQLSRHHQAPILHRTEIQSANHILLVVTVLAVDTLSIHQCQLIIEMVLEEETIKLDTQVTTIVHTMKRVGTTARQERDTLGADIDQLQFRWRKRILQRITILELTHTHRHGTVFRQAIIRVKLLNHTREIVHEQEGPAIRDLSLRPKQGALQVDEVGVVPILVLPSVTSLSITIQSNSFRKVLQPIRLVGF